MANMKYKMNSSTYNFKPTQGCTQIARRHNTVSHDATVNKVEISKYKIQRHKMAYNTDEFQISKHGGKNITQIVKMLYLHL